MNADKKRSGNRSFKEFLKWFAAIFSLVALLFSLFIYVFLDPLVKKRIIREVNEASAGLYILEIGNLDAKFRSGAIYMDEVWLRPNRSILKEMQVKDTAGYIPNVNLYFDSVSISSIGWLRYLLNDEKLEIGKVYILEPDFIVTTELKSSTVKQKSRNFLDLLPGIIAAFTGSLRIERIVVNNGKLHYDLIAETGVIHQLADSVYLDLKKIRIDTLAQNNALYSEKAEFHFHNYRLTSSDSLNLFRIENVRGVVHDSSLSIENIYYFQKDSADEKFKDQLEVQVDQVTNKGVNYGSLLKEQKIHLRTMILKDPKVNMISSEEPVRKYQVEDTAGQSILDDMVPYLSGSFSIDTLVAQNGNIQYLIRNAKKSVFQKADKIDMLFSRVLVDTLKTGTKVFAEDMRLNLKDYFLEKDTTTKLNIASFRAAFSDSMFNFRNISYISFEKGRYKLEAEEIRGTGVDFISALDKRKGKADTLEINKPVIKVYSLIEEVNHPEKKTFSNKSIQQVFYELLGSFADVSLKVNKFYIHDGDLDYTVRLKENLIEQKARNLLIVVDSILIDSSKENVNRFYQSFYVRMNDYEMKAHKNNTHLQIKNIHASSYRRYFQMSDINLTQIYSFQDDQRFYFTNSIRRIHASDVLYRSLVQDQKVIISLVTIDSMNLDIRLDLTKADNVDLSSKMPSDFMNSIGVPLDIQNVNINQSYLSYTIRDSVAREPGMLTFGNIDASIENFTNDSTRMSIDTPARLLAKAEFMEEAELNLQLTIDLLQEGLNGSYCGTLGSMNGQTFNELLLFAGVKIEEGNLDSGRFQAKIVNGTASGELILVYDNLDVKVLDPKTEKVSRLKSLFGNIIVKDSNPKDKGDPPEVVKLSAQLEKDDGFFQFLWKVIREGVVDTVTKDALLDITTKQ